MSKKTLRASFINLMCLECPAYSSRLREALLRVTQGTHWTTCWQSNAQPCNVDQHILCRMHELQLTTTRPGIASSHLTWGSDCGWDDRVPRVETAERPELPEGSTFAYHNISVVYCSCGNGMPLDPPMSKKLHRSC